ncbi:MAG: spore coat associated protein CotJA [Eubacteriales bacterium]|nr:spore coat associated protein CotJA [Eubacteriales bacterium]
MNQCKMRESKSMCHHDDPIAGMPLAMAYVPWQTFHHTFETCKALQVGTIFPELCKPFCGKRGGC